MEWIDAQKNFIESNMIFVVVVDAVLIIAMDEKKCQIKVNYTRSAASISQNGSQNDISRNSSRVGWKSYKSKIVKIVSVEPNLMGRDGEWVAYENVMGG